MAAAAAHGVSAVAAGDGKAVRRGGAAAGRCCGRAVLRPGGFVSVRRCGGVAVRRRVRLTVSLSSSGFSSVSASYDGRLSTAESADSGIIRLAPEVSFSKLYRNALIAVSLQPSFCRKRHTPPLTPCSLAYLVRSMAPGSVGAACLHLIGVLCHEVGHCYSCLCAKRSKTEGICVRLDRDLCLPRGNHQRTRTRDKIRDRSSDAAQPQLLLRCRLRLRRRRRRQHSRGRCVGGIGSG